MNFTLDINYMNKNKLKKYQCIVVNVLQLKNNPEM